MIRRILPLLGFIIVGCSADIEISEFDRTFSNIKANCSTEFIKLNSDISQAYDVYENAFQKTKLTESDGSGFVQFWNGGGSKEIMDIATEPMRTFYPHNEICTVYYRTDQTISGVEYRFVTEEEFYEAANKQG